MLLVAGCAMGGNPDLVQAMSLFMGGEEPNQSAPPSKAVINKPKPSASKSGTTTATTAAIVPGKESQGAPTPATGSTGPVASTPPVGTSAQTASTPKKAVPGSPTPVASSPGTVASIHPSGQPAQTASTPVAQGHQSPEPVSKTTELQSKTVPVPPDQDKKSAKETLKPTISALVPEAELTPALPETDGYTYDPKSRRDPFQSLTSLVKVDRTRMELPPLQRVQLSDVKLLGIIWGGYGYYGLVRTPDGKGYTVKEGMLMGTNKGVISAITNTAVTVSEPSIDMAGNKSTKDIVILLRPKEVS